MQIDEGNPYLRYGGSYRGFWVDAKALALDAGLTFRPSFRATLLGGRAAVRLPRPQVFSSIPSTYEGESTR